MFSVFTKSSDFVFPSKLVLYEGPIKARSTRIRIVLNPQLFSVRIRLPSTNTHPANSVANLDIFESALHEYAPCGGGNF